MRLVTPALVLLVTSVCALVACDENEDSPESDPGTAVVPGIGELKRDNVSYPSHELLRPIADRERAPLCGREGITTKPGSPFSVRSEPRARACLFEAWSTGGEAEIETTLATVEGPIPIVIVVRSDGVVDEYSNDPFGGGPRARECRALEIDGHLLRAHDAIPARPPETLGVAECERTSGF